MLYFMGLVLLLLFTYFAALFFSIRGKKKNTSIQREEICCGTMVLMVKNQEDNIEGIVRSLCSGGFFGRRSLEQHLLIIDMGSTDGTLEILGRLQKSYPLLEVQKSSYPYAHEKFFVNFQVESQKNDKQP